MKKSFSGTNLLRAAAVVTSLTMLLASVSCGGGSASQNSTDATSSLIELNPLAVPESLEKFLVCFTDWYETEDTEHSRFDSSNAGDGSTNILRSIVGNMPCVDYDVYPVTKYEEIWNNKKPDPKKWASETGGCYMVFDQKAADWIAVNIFNVSEDDLAAMRRQGEQEKWFYLYKGNYYTPAGGVGDPLTEYRLSSVKTDGRRYYVNYESRFLFDDPDNAEYDISYYAELEIKTIDGRDYWSLFKYSRTSGYN